MAKPKYQPVCTHCAPNRQTGVRRPANTYIFINGVTSLVCGGCATRIGKENGIFTPAQKRAVEERNERKAKFGGQS